MRRLFNKVKLVLTLQQSQVLSLLLQQYVKDFLKQNRLEINELALIFNIVRLIDSKFNNRKLSVVTQKKLRYTLNVAEAHTLLTAINNFYLTDENIYEQNLVLTLNSEIFKQI